MIALMSDIQERAIVTLPPCAFRSCLHDYLTTVAKQNRKFCNIARKYTRPANKIWLRLLSAFETSF